jgi:tetratricopeptide (TPR) repeat protein
MSLSRHGRLAALIGATILLAVCAAFFAYRVAYPQARILRVRIVTDPGSRFQQGATPADLKRRVESLSPLFEKEAAISLSVSGFTDVRFAAGTDPEALGRFLDLRTPREEADILVAFWSAGPGDPRLGSAPPYNSVAVVRLDSGSPQRDQAALAHQLASLFGVAESADAASFMHTPPTALKLDPVSRSHLRDFRAFDFRAGLAGTNGRMRSRVLAALKQQPPGNITQAYCRLGELLLRDGQPDAAVLQFREAVKSDGKDIPARLALSRALARDSQLPAAEAEARAALQLGPNQADPYYQLGYVLARSGNPEAAIPEFQKAIAIAPGSARYHAGLAVAYGASIGEFEASRKEFEEATRLDPNDAFVKADLAYTKAFHQQLEQNAARAEAEVRAHPDSGPAHNHWAMLLLRLGHVDDAIAENRRALELGPEDWQMHYTMAVALFAKHDFVDSSAELEKAKKLGSGSRPHLEESLKAALASSALR